MECRDYTETTGGATTPTEYDHGCPEGQLGTTDHATDTPRIGDDGACPEPSFHDGASLQLHCPDGDNATTDRVRSKGTRRRRLYSDTDRESVVDSGGSPMCPSAHEVGDRNSYISRDSTEGGFLFLLKPTRRVRRKTNPMEVQHSSITTSQASHTSGSASAHHDYQFVEHRVGHTSDLHASSA